MLREILIVVLGVLGAMFLRSLVLAALRNTVVWYDQKMGVCLKCGATDSRYDCNYQGVNRCICEGCARQEFGLSYRTKVAEGFLRERT